MRRRHIGRIDDDGARRTQGGDGVLDHGFGRFLAGPPEIHLSGHADARTMQGVRVQAARVVGVDVWRRVQGEAVAKVHTREGRQQRRRIGDAARKRSGRVLADGERYHARAADQADGWLDADHAGLTGGGLDGVLRLAADGRHAQPGRDCAGRPNAGAATAVVALAMGMAHHAAGRAEL